MVSKFAIRSGNVTLVEELLGRGCDIEETIGQLQTTPLQWAIWHNSLDMTKSLDMTRLLLSKGARQDHIKLRGWNTVFFCWNRLRHGEPSMLEFLNLLADDAYLDLDVLDARDWTVLDRVAAVGTSEEAVRLIELGADPYQESLPLRWNAIHHAVFDGNYDTFKSLLPYYADSTSMVDDPGWTLLHVAASAGQGAICRHLLELGADPCALSEPYNSHMPEVLMNRRCTPCEAAASQSEEREQSFRSLVDTICLSQGHVIVDQDGLTSSDVEFVDACEYL